MKVPFLSLDTIERQASALLWKYEEKHGALATPVAVERIAESVVDLVIEWNSIPERPGETILAGLDPANRKVVFNQNRQRTYDDTDGLYNTVLAHEIGHWVLHVDGNEPELQAVLPGTGMAARFMYRSRGPNSPLEWQAHSFMGYLLMPHRLLKTHIDGEDIYDWGSLYYLKEKFDVTISALIIRLKKMGLIYIDDDKTIFRSEGEAKGQARMV